MHIMWDLTQCVYIRDFNQCVYLPDRRVEEGRQAFLGGCWWQDKKHEPSRYVSQFPYLLDNSQIPFFFLLPLVNTDSFVTGREKMKGKQQASTKIRRSTLTMFDFREQEMRSKAFKSSTEFPQLFLKGFL